MEELRQFLGLAGFPVVAALVEVAKRAAPELGDRWWPMVALALGIGFNLVVGWRLGLDLWLAAILGLVTGLAASGLYSQARTLGPSEGKTSGDLASR